MQTRCLLIAVLPLGCTANETDVSTRASSPAECPAGGTTLLIGDEVHPVCNGIGEPGPTGPAGERGADGATGPRGATGSDGLPAVPPEIGLGTITEAIACSSVLGDPLLSLSAKTWIFSSGWAFAEFYFSDSEGSFSTSDFHPPGYPMTEFFAPESAELATSIIAQELRVDTRRWAARQDGTPFLDESWASEDCIVPAGL